MNTIYDIYIYIISVVHSRKWNTKCTEPIHITHPTAVFSKPRGELFCDSSPLSISENEATVLAWPGSGKQKKIASPRRCHQVQPQTKTSKNTINGWYKPSNMGWFNIVLPALEMFFPVEHDHFGAWIWDLHQPNSPKLRDAEPGGISFPTNACI